MLAIEREFGWPVAEQVGAVAEGRYTREINERVFQTEEWSSVMDAGVRILGGIE